MPENYNSELALKKWAKLCRYIGIGLFSLVSFVGFVLMMVLLEDIEIFAFLIFLGMLLTGGLFYLGFVIMSDFIYGFAEIVGNTKRMADGAVAPAPLETKNDLPEL